MLEKIRNLNLLRSFEAAARHNSYGKAAQELYISQAAVSQQMRQLEQVLACQLFIRKGKNMLLTQQGLALFEATKTAFNTLQISLRQLHKEELAGNLTISSTQAFISLWLMPRLNKFSRLFPQISVKLTASAQFEDLQQQHIDLAVRFSTRTPEGIHKPYTCEYLGEEPVLAVCSPELIQKQPINQASDLLQHMLISLNSAGPYDWCFWFEQAGVEGYPQHQKITKVHSTDMALTAAQSGYGFALIAKYLCDEQLTLGQLITPLDITHPNKVKRYLIYAKDSAKMARLQCFMDWLKAEMAEKAAEQSKVNFD